MRKIKLFFAALMVFAATSLAMAQNKTVTGTVTDASNGTPVPFAALQIKGTSTGTSTNADGKYSIQVPADGVLVFTSIGYKTVEVTVAGRSVVNAVLEPATELLDET
ncbi:MAG: carboxypeptidase-like regulatory domain-containing protein, partial [Bacteroidales bacterium]|nr:carboxypeptidase-like regulatory domain-containing protein [Bacteroidales bacterium]